MMEYNETRELSIRIVDYHDRYQVIIEYKGDNPHDETYNNPYINCMVNKGLKGVYPVSIVHNSFHDTVYDQTFYNEMIEDLFESHILDPIISPETLEMYNANWKDASPVNDNGA